MTMRRFFFIARRDRATLKEEKKTSNAQRPTSNAELGGEKQGQTPNIEWKTAETLSVEQVKTPELGRI
jgi:hypothetical protein